MTINPVRLQLQRERERNRYKRQRLRRLERLCKNQDYNDLIETLVIHEQPRTVVDKDEQPIRRINKRYDDEEQVAFRPINSTLFNMLMSHFLGIEVCPYVTILDS